jgi:hypothetical protein
MPVDLHMACLIIHIREEIYKYYQILLYIYLHMRDYYEMPGKAKMPETNWICASSNIL